MTPRAKGKSKRQNFDFKAAHSFEVDSILTPTNHTHPHPAHGATWPARASFLLTLTADHSALRARDESRR